MNSNWWIYQASSTKLTLQIHCVVLWHSLECVGLQDNVVALAQQQPLLAPSWVYLPTSEMFSIFCRLMTSKSVWFSYSTENMTWNSVHKHPQEVNRGCITPPLCTGTRMVCVSTQQVQQQQSYRWVVVYIICVFFNLFSRTARTIHPVSTY